MDILGPLEKTKHGNEYILVITEYLSRYVEAFPLSNTKSETIAKVFVNQIVLKHGCPKSILTDRGSNFISDFMKNLYELLDINKLNTTAFHPQCNSLTERFNRTLISMLTPFVNKEKNNWDELLPYLIFAYNTSMNETTKATPFEVMYCRKVNLPNSLNLNNDIPYVQSVAEGLKLREEIKSEIDQSQEKQKYYYDKGRKESSFEVGDLVMLNNPVAKKLESKWTGPYKIIDKTSNLNVKISLPNSSRTHGIVHISRLKKVEDKTDQQVISVSKQIQDEEFELEKILDKKKMKSNDGKVRTYYLIKWKNYDNSYNTWEPSSNLVNAREILKKYENELKRKKKK